MGGVEVDGVLASAENSSHVETVVLRVSAMPKHGGGG